MLITEPHYSSREGIIGFLDGVKAWAARPMTIDNEAMTRDGGAQRRFSRSAF
jgi:hypothetical protein